MGRDERRLRRGLGDLLAEHSTELPFLGAEASDDPPEAADALPVSAAPDAEPSDLLEALAAYLQARGHLDHLTRGGDSLSLDGLLLARCLDEGIEVTFRDHAHDLPLVASDLTGPGLARGRLGSKRHKAVVVLLEWRMETRRLIERLLDHWTAEGHWPADEES